MESSLRPCLASPTRSPVNSERSLKAETTAASNSRRAFPFEGAWCGSAIPSSSAVCYTEWNMPISKDLLDILVCPLCKATVELKPDQSGLKCVQCKRVYPIRDEIPVMLIDEAKVEE